MFFYQHSTYYKCLLYHQKFPQSFDEEKEIAQRSEIKLNINIVVIVDNFYLLSGVYVQKNAVDFVNTFTNSQLAKQSSKFVSDERKARVRKKLQRILRERTYGAKIC